MSTFRLISVPSLRLQSLGDVQTRLGIEQDDVHDEEHLAGHERVRQLGRDIRSRVQDFNDRLARVDDIEEGSPLQQAAVALARASSVQEALVDANQPLLSQVASRHLQNQGANLQVIDEARALLESGATESLPTLAPQLETAVEQLNTASQAAHRELLQAESEVLADKTTDSLEALGYDVRMKQLQDGLLVRGLKEDLSIVAQVDEQGALNVDAAGFEGTECEAELDRLSAELERRGVTVAIEEAVFHGKPQGSVLTEKASDLLPKGDFNPLKEEVQEDDGRRERRRKQLLKRQQRKLRRR